MNANKIVMEHPPSTDPEPRFPVHKTRQEQQEPTPTERRFLKALHWMRCPKCGLALVTQRHSGLDIDFCPACEEVCLNISALEAIVAPENEFLRSCLRNLHPH